MADTNDELVIKVALEIEEKDLDRAKKELRGIQAQGQKAASEISAIRVSGPTTSSSGAMSVSGGGTEEIVDLLAKSQKTLLDLLELAKRSATPEEGGTNFNKEERNKALKESLLGTHGGGSGGGGGLSAGTLIGGAAGGILGLLGGPAVAAVTAEIGATVGGLAQKVFGEAGDKILQLSDAFGNRLEEDEHLRQLSYQSGQSVEALYKLQQQAKLSGTSLEDLVETNQQTANELIGGISDQKAQLLMALRINPMDLLRQSGGDIGKFNQELYNRATKSLSGASAYQRTAVLELLGFPAEQQDARRRLNSPEFKNRAQAITNTATNGGKTPFASNEQLNSEILAYRGAKLDFQASIRELLTHGGIAGRISAQMVKLQSDTVEVLRKILDKLPGSSGTFGKAPAITIQPGTLDAAAATAGQGIFNYFSQSSATTKAASK